VIVISSAGSRAGSACIWWMGKIDAQALGRRVKKTG
jgi:membrane protein YqaA with SNARE-associated domain